ncbi:esterase CG5412 [Oratosquilla oratoria]|uniref:esterase CG5412 n=1 Tax=Oratosquilla oratoria TaxID=337810 RepID=UPI003F768D44
MTEVQRPLKLLCLHGYRQSGEIFRERTGAFRKLLKKHAEFVFVTAPLSVPPLEGNGDGGRGWWFSQDDSYYRAQDETKCAKGFEESLAVLDKIFKEEGPFDGIVGFSQGGAMLGLLCGLLEQKQLSFAFKFAIFVSSYRSRSAPHQDLYKQNITLPTLHVFGDTDQVIEKPMSEEFLKYFKDPEVLNHPGGHFIPTSGAQKKTYIAFLEKMRELFV